MMRFLTPDRPITSIPVLVLMTVVALSSGCKQLPDSDPEIPEHSLLNATAVVPYKAAVDWTCDAGFSAPLMLNDEGDVGCWSIDGKNCLWFQQWSCQTKIDFIKTHSMARWAPLFCGKAHKSHWGITGYDVKNHWCAQGKQKLEAMKAAKTPKVMTMNEARPSTHQCGYLESLDAQGQGECQTSGFFAPLNMENYAEILRPVFVDRSCHGNVSFNSKGDALATWCERDTTQNNATIKLRHYEDETGMFRNLASIGPVASINLEFHGSQALGDPILEKTTLGLFPHVTYSDDQRIVLTHETAIFPGRNDEPILESLALFAESLEHKPHNPTVIGRSAPDDIARFVVDGQTRAEHYERLGSYLRVYTFKEYGTNDASRMLNVQFFDKGSRSWVSLLQKPLSTPAYHVSRSEDGASIMVSFLESPSTSREPYEICLEGCTLKALIYRQGLESSWTEATVAEGLYGAVFNINGQINNKGDAVVAWLLSKDSSNRNEYAPNDARDLFVSAKSNSSTFHAPKQLDPATEIEAGTSLTPEVFLGVDAHGNSRAVVTWWQHRRILLMQPFLVRQATYDFGDAQPSWWTTDSQAMDELNKLQGLLGDSANVHLAYKESPEGDGILVVTHDRNTDKPGGVFAATTFRKEGTKNISYMPFQKLDTLNTAAISPEIVRVADGSHRIVWSQLSGHTWSHWFAPLKAGGRMHRPLETLTAQVDADNQIQVNWQWPQKEATDINVTYQAQRREGRGDAVKTATMPLDLADSGSYTMSIDASDWEPDEYDIKIQIHYSLAGIPAKTDQSNSAAIRILNQGPTKPAAPVMSDLTAWTHGAYHEVLYFSWQESGNEGFSREYCYYELTQNAGAPIRSWNHPSGRITSVVLDGGRYRGGDNYGSIQAGTYDLKVMCRFKDQATGLSVDSAFTNLSALVVAPYQANAYEIHNGERSKCGFVNRNPMTPEVSGTHGVVLTATYPAEIVASTRWMESTANSIELDNTLKPKPSAKWDYDVLTYGSSITAGTFRYDVSQKLGTRLSSRRSLQPEKILLLRFCVKISSNPFRYYQSEFYLSRPGQPLEPISNDELLNNYGGSKYWAD